MRLLTRYLPNDHNLFLFGDDHEGTILRSKKGWNKLLDMMNSSYDGLNPDRNWGIHHGDIMEAIPSDDKRYDPRMLPEGSTIPREQENNCVKNLEPIKDKLLVGVVSVVNLTPSQRLRIEERKKHLLSQVVRLQAIEIERLKEDGDG